MKRFILIITLACALSGVALAGDVHSTDSPAPSAPPPLRCTIPIDNTEPICEPVSPPEDPLVTLVLNIISAVTL